MISINLEKTKQNKLYAVIASIFIHLVIGSILILGLSNDLHFTSGLHKLNLAWVSLESISGNDIISPDGKRADRKQSRITAIQRDKISSLPTLNATKNIPVQIYSMNEERSGQATGTDSSTNFSVATAMPAAGYSSAFVTASPLYRENNPPVYPAMARLRGYEGVVVVSAEILPDGRVGSTAIIQSSGYTILDKSAMEAVKLWKFEPAKKAGKPFAIRVKLPIKFVLHDDNSQS